MIIDKLTAAIKATGNPTVVGLDPRLDFIPKFIKAQAFELYGATPKGVSEAFFRFNTAIIDQIYDIVPAVKPQIAMYEQYGADGISAYIKTIEYAKSRGLIVIGDVKRSDIASTAEAYSNGHIGRVNISGNSFEIFKEDFITLNPYLGYESIEPFIENCIKYERGLFVLVKTSNPNSGEIQDLITQPGAAPLYLKICELVEKWGKALTGQCGFSSIGAVVGATHPAQSAELRKLFPGVFFLVPGYGTQGATAQDLSVCFDSKGSGAIINNSRGIIAAYQKHPYNQIYNKDDYNEEGFAEAARQAAIDMREDISSVL